MIFFFHEIWYKFLFFRQGLMVMDLKYLVSIQNFLWQGPVMAVMLFTGIYLTIALRGKQFTNFKRSISLVFNSNKQNDNLKATGDLSPFQSLMTALAGSIGTGNITGIATAVAVGGYGSLFWMWVMAAFGMATAYAECFLSIKYREVNSNHEISGGPMYVLKNGLGSKKMSVLYAMFAGISAIGIGCLAQANSVVDAIDSYLGCDRLILGGVLAAITAATVIGGVKSIGRVASVIVPFMALLYVCCGLIIILFHWHNVPQAIYMIFSSAFTGQAAVGGAAGATVLMAIENGAKYGIFANEAGLGSLSIAAASARTDDPAEQGLRSSFGVFFATMIVCTITGLLLAVSMGSTSGLKGSALAVAAFGSVHKHFSVLLVIALSLFAFTTMLGWCYYGEKSLEFLFGPKIVPFYRWAFVLMVVVGACMELDVVWLIANLSSACMAFPNLIGILLLRKKLH
jgi:AGCS family alanine or glycine:cation symporter